MVPKIQQFFTLEEENSMARRRPVRRRKEWDARRRPNPKWSSFGVSTGGPAALGAIVPAFPAAFPLPILIVQHMPPLFTGASGGTAGINLEAERIGSRGSRGSGARKNTDRAEGDYHMRVRRNGVRIMVSLDQGPTENSCRPSVDVLFRSVEEIYGPTAISVILTGMGCDGLRGMEVLKAAGAYVIN